MPLKPEAEGSERPISNTPNISISSVLPQEVPEVPSIAGGMIIRGRSSQTTNPVRRSILKPPTFHVHFLIPQQHDDADNTVTPLPTYITDKIPLELVHYCIDSLRHDKDALRSCALVCKAWLTRARPLLLPKRLTVSLQDKTGSDVLSLLTARGSSLVQFVHTLSIQSSATFPIPTLFPTLHGTESGGQVISFNQYLLIFIGSGSLRTLILQGITVPPRPWRSTSALPVQLRALPHLTRLELTRCAISTLNELFLILCARRTLTDLSLTDITILHWQPERPPPPNLHLPRALGTLRLRTPGQALILKWILSHNTVPSLRAVALGGMRGDDELRTAGAFLARLGASLEHLSLSLVRAIPGGEFPRYLRHFSLAKSEHANSSCTYFTFTVDLSYNTRLQSLAISHYLISEFARENISPKGGLVHYLRQIKSLHVARIELDFVNAPQDLLLMPWAAVAAELDAPKFLGLKLVTMRVAGDKKKWETLMREIFTRLSTNHILRIRWDSSA